VGLTKPAVDKFVVMVAAARRAKKAAARRARGRVGVTA